MDKTKSYKLIKDFPGRNIDDIIYWSEEPVGRWFWKTGGCIPPDLTRDLQGLPKLEEWFEEIVEKEYEILSFITTDIHISNTNGKLPKSSIIEKVGKWYNAEQGSWTFGDNASEILNKCSVNIYSVKRLSDGEIFTIGDKVEYKISSGWSEMSISNIIGFEITENRKQLLIKTTTSNVWAYLSDTVRKLQKVLFTTEDGIDIRNEIAVVYVVDTSAFKTFTKKAINYLRQYDYLSYYKAFSTEKAAENYIKCNKSVLNYKEVSATFDMYGNDGAEFKDALTKLVKSKL